jgi:hypothetical protein
MKQASQSYLYVVHIHFNPFHHSFCATRMKIVWISYLVFEMAKFLKLVHLYCVKLLLASGF